MEDQANNESKGIIKKPSDHKLDEDLRVTFVDEVNHKSLAEVHEVESYKKFNQTESGMCSSCHLL
jgi:hypothetical protein